MEKCFVNQMRNGNTLPQRIIAMQPRVSTVFGPQTIYFWNIKHKSGAKIASQAQIQRLSPPVDEVVTENEKNS